MTEVIMPKMGDGMEEGTLLEWLKKDGEKVKSGEIIGTIQTDKATLELEAPGNGVLSGLLIKGGETVPVGKPIAALLKEGEALPAGWGGASAPQAAATPAKTEAPQVASEGEPVEAAASTAVVAANGAAARVKASPLARRVASEKGVDLASLAGSGPGGRIVERDVLAAGSKKTAPAAAAISVAATAEDKEIPLTKIRSITAQRTAQSKQEVPHYYVTVEVDVEKIAELRAQFEAEESGKVSVNDFVVKATVLALQQMPEVNASFGSGKIVEYGAVHMGLAVALEGGLTVPVIKNAHSLSLRQISAAAKDLVGRARENKLSLDELTGSTFSISNMGMLAVDNFAAIINQPNSGILAISSARKKVVVNDEDELEVRQRMNITASFDHRVVDGAVGAKFINLVKDGLENPTRLLA